MNLRKDQPVLSTARVTPGESRTKEFLEEIVKRVPARFPLGQHHDVVSPYCGHMKNFRVVPAPEKDEWLVIVDVYLETDALSDAVGSGLTACSELTNEG
jgi:hypothetical protein